jgi:hypothetical protein
MVFAGLKRSEGGAERHFQNTVERIKQAGNDRIAAEDYSDLGRQNRCGQRTSGMEEERKWRKNYHRADRRGCPKTSLMPRRDSITVRAMRVADDATHIHDPPAGLRWLFDWRSRRERPLLYILAALSPMFLMMAVYAVHLLHEQAVDRYRVYRLTDAQVQMLRAGPHPAGACIKRQDHSI